MKIVKNTDKIIQDSKSEITDKQAEEAFRTIIKWIGEDPTREGLASTPKRVVKAFKEYFRGYGQDYKSELGKTFGDIKKEDFGLIELMCSERSGLVWVMLNPEENFNIDKWLGDFAPELDTLNLEDWHIHEQREIDGPGWKVALDGYLEAYHHNQLHGDTVGKHTVGNLLVLDTYGPHQRLTFGRKTLKDLIDKPETEWKSPQENIRLI